MAGVRDFDELQGRLRLAHARYDFRGEEVALGALEFEDGAADLRPLFPEQGNFVRAEAAVDPEEVGVLLGDVLAGVVEAEAMLGGGAVVVGGRAWVRLHGHFDVLVDGAPAEGPAVHAADLVAGGDDAHLGAVVEADEVLEVGGVVGGVGDGVAGAERCANVVAGGDADCLGECGEVFGECGDGVAVAGVGGVAVSALVEGDDAELVAELAGDVVPVVGVAALPVDEQEVAGWSRRPSRGSGW